MTDIRLRQEAEVERDIVSPVSTTTNDADLLDALITEIRVAVSPGVSSEARASSAAACRAILNALEAQGGTSVPARTPLTSSVSPLLHVLSHLVSMSRKRILNALDNKSPARERI
jgi:hypothetical protein